MMCPIEENRVVKKDVLLSVDIFLIFCKSRMKMIHFWIAKPEGLFLQKVSMIYTNWNTVYENNN